MDPDELFNQDEKQLASQWEEQLEHNILALLREHDSFVIQQYYDKVFLEVLGLARTKHLRAALKKLHSNGIVSSDSRGELFGKRVVRRHLPTQSDG